MKTVKFKITAFEVNSSQQDIRLTGHYTGDSGKVSGQIIVRGKAKPHALFLKKGGNNWILEIMLPPKYWDAFVAIIDTRPNACRFDPGPRARVFKIKSKRFQGSTSTSARLRLRLEN